MDGQQEQSATLPGPSVRVAGARRRRAAIAGHEGDVATARELLADPDAGVRATALGALARAGAVTAGDVAAAAADAAPVVRIRAAEVLAALPDLDGDLAPLLADDDPEVVETAAWAAGERVPARAAGSGEDHSGTVATLAALATGHGDALCREAAVAALGAVGDEAGLPAVLAATGDRPAVRRRAVIALAPFSGPEVDAALERARTDRDWQVRQAAEDLLED
jgi:HEAT repeat protein